METRISVKKSVPEKDGVCISQKSMGNRQRMQKSIFEKLFNSFSPISETDVICKNRKWDESPRFSVTDQHLEAAIS
jgi:hypothetical protein